jgi:hypothetical protein
MTWVQSSSQRSVVLHADLARVRDFLGHIVECGRLMPGVVSLAEVEPGVFHYQLAEFSDGAVRFTPDYQTRFDTSDPGNLRWEPHGEHNFRSWGVFHTEPGAVDGEVVLEISVRSEADLAIDPILIPLVEPFARLSTDQVTQGFLARIQEHLEAGGAG